MIVVTLAGGIGNQLFQYAFAHELAAHNDGIVVINKYKFLHSKDNHGDYLLDGMRVNGYCEKEVNNWLLSWLFSLIQRSKCIRRSKLVKNDGKRQFVLNMEKGLIWTQKSEQLVEKIPSKLGRRVYYLEGYYQWPKIMDNTINYICENVLFSEVQESSIVAVEEKIKKSHSVCVHIRRGDYVDFKALQVCNNDYFFKGMKTIADKVENPTFFVFSDDIVWVKNNYDFPFEVEYVTSSNNTFLDLYLMSLCNHFIISNSTFSWWAQEFSTKRDKVVVAPDKWTTDGRATELLKGNFVRLEVIGNFEK